jgi:hypothetical protein
MTSAQAVAGPAGVSHEAEFEKPKPLDAYQPKRLPAVRVDANGRASGADAKPVGRPGGVKPASPVAASPRTRPVAKAAIDGQEQAYPYDTTLTPARQIGRFMFTGGDGGDSHCSGTLVAAENQSTVITAAHCLYEIEEGWDKSGYFCPGYRAGRCELGRWPARLFAVETPWFTARNRSYDVGVVLLEPRYVLTHTETRTETVTEERDCSRFRKRLRYASSPARKRRLKRKLRRCRAKGPIVYEEEREVEVSEWRNGTAQSTAGAQGIAWNRSGVQDVWAFGYPATDWRWPGPVYDSDYLTWCPQRQTTYDATEQNLLIWCGMTGGSSGGPWIVSPSEEWVGYVNSVNSYKDLYWASSDCTTAGCPLSNPDAVVYGYGPYFANPERDFYYEYSAK